jgi:hypothetical protein
MPAMLYLLLFAIASSNTLIIKEIAFLHTQKRSHIHISQNSDRPTS